MDGNWINFTTLFALDAILATFCRLFVVSESLSTIQDEVSLP